MARALARVAGRWAQALALLPPVARGWEASCSLARGDWAKVTVAPWQSPTSRVLAWRGPKTGREPGSLPPAGGAAQGATCPGLSGLEGPFSATPALGPHALAAPWGPTSLLPPGLQAIAELGWARPTLIQEKAIPLALEGKDLLARARTGSGKTAAYAIPLIQHLLQVKMSPSVAEQAVRGLVLVPTKELGQQVLQMIRQLTAYCSREVRVADVSGQVDMSAQRPILMEKPDVVVGTPSRVLAHLQAHSLSLRCSLEVLVLDEADLLFSFGFEEDLKSLLCHFPKIYQSFLMSATFSEEVQALRELVLHNPVTLKLQESPLPEAAQLRQYQIRCAGEEDKFLLLYALLKLGLVRGKAILFVSSVGRGYRLKLFLEQFSIPACVLNAELPVHSRCHIISQYNRGCYDYLVATDEQTLAEPMGRPQRKKGARAEKGKDPEFGVARGIDFQNVAAVINFDPPPSVESYIHRAGRTARADNPGTALTFVTHPECPLLAEIEEALAGESAEPVLRPYQFRMEEVEGLRYRCRDAMRSVTKQAIKEARLREIKEELLNSEKLKTYFEDNPHDLRLLRHDRPLHPAIVKPHLRNVPEYLVPPALRAVARPLLGQRKRRKHLASSSRPKGGFQARAGRNPLRSFRYLGRRPRRPASKGKAP